MIAGIVVGAIAIADLASCATTTQWGRATESTRPPDRSVEIAVTRRGFEPSTIEVGTGETVRFVVTRTVARTCADRIVLYLDDSRTLQRALPVGERITITLRFDRRGELGFSCPMKMYGGTIEVR